MTWFELTAEALRRSGVKEAEIKERLEYATFRMAMTSTDEVKFRPGLDEAQATEAMINLLMILFRHLDNPKTVAQVKRFTDEACKRRAAAN